MSPATFPSLVEGNIVASHAYSCVTKNIATVLDRVSLSATQSEIGRIQNNLNSFAKCM